MKSNTDMQEAKRTKPYTEQALPFLANDLIDNIEPKETESRIDKLDPIRLMPYLWSHGMRLLWLCGCAAVVWLCGYAMWQCGYVWKCGCRLAM